MKWGADVIKVCASGGVLSESDPVDVPQLTPAELGAIVSEAHAWGRKVAAHAHGDLAARQVIEAGVDSIEHGTFLTTATLQLMKQKGVYPVPTRSAVNWVVAKADSYPPKIGAKARAAGGADTAMLKVGMTPAAALLSSSQGAAKLLGISQETGTLEAGKFADIVAVPGNVLGNIRATETPSLVLKQGAIVRGGQ